MRLFNTVDVFLADGSLAAGLAVRNRPSSPMAQCNPRSLTQLRRDGSLRDTSLQHSGKITLSASRLSSQFRQYKQHETLRQDVSARHICLSKVNTQFDFRSAVLWQCESKHIMDTLSMTRHSFLGRDDAQALFLSSVLPLRDVSHKLTQGSCLHSRQFHDEY